jgi:hypothetical protein
MSWISVKDRLPKAHEAVLAHCEIEGFSRIFEAFCLMFSGWSHITTQNCVEKLPGVTHWMPLPALPPAESTCWINPDYALPPVGEVVIVNCFDENGENQYAGEAWVDDKGIWKHMSTVPAVSHSWTGYSTTVMEPGVSELKNVQYWMTK